MEIDAVVSHDIIEDASEGESDDAVVRGASRMSLPSSDAPGIAGRFETFLGARQEGSQQRDFAEDEEAPASPIEGRGADDSIILNTEEAETLAGEDVNFNEDGTLTGGPAVNDDMDEEEVPEEEDLPFKPVGSTKSFLHRPPQDATVAAKVVEEDDGSSDAEGADQELGTADEPALPDEHWSNRPVAERELWERVRPRALRREALRTQELKFPVATMNRLMRVHPDMQSKSSEATEIVNVATVLLLQAMAQSAVRGRKAAGKTVTLSDVKQICLNNHELNFMLPLSATLDASAMAISKHDGHDATTSRAAASTAVTAAAPGQSTLLFAAGTTAPAQEFADADGDEPLDVVTVQGNLEQKVSTPQEKQGSKRKIPQSAKKGPTKAPRQEATKQDKPIVSGGGLGNFFKRAGSN